MKAEAAPLYKLFPGLRSAYVRRIWYEGAKYFEGPAKRRLKKRKQ